MRLLYHNHDFEMVLIDGKPAIDWLLAGADPQNVGFEADLAWIVAGGQDAAALLQQYSGRVPRVHAKDLGDNPAERGLADVGSGRLDWETILPAVLAAQAEWIVVEHDQPLDPIASIRRSQAFLAEKLKIG
jgi:sugar phosphate isomerase/epimerase